MAFEGITEKLQGVFKKLRGKGRISESDVNTAMREVRLALLEADVNFKVCKDFIASVSEKCKGADVLETLNPAQMIIKLVHEELIALMGGQDVKLSLSPKPPTVIMLCGLQGAGKTTNGAKLALFYKKQNKRPLLAACDVYRPAAIKQLQIVGGQAGIPVFEGGQGDPVKIAKEAVEHAKKHGNDIVFIDTAGRLHLDETLMDELTRIKAAVNPSCVLLTIDAMTGQDAVTVAGTFNEKLGIDGVMLTKLDGDARGGAALSVKAVTGRPIMFAGVGEKLDNIEIFHPDRMASRILGMGDMLTFIEKAESLLDEKKAAEMEKRLRAGRFTLNDFHEQMGQIRNMGSLSDIAGMLPGVDKRALQNAKIDENAMRRTEAIILSMTPREREIPEILNSSRKRRVAKGAGTRVEEINKLLKQFEMMKQLSKQIASGKIPKGFGGFN